MTSRARITPALVLLFAPACRDHASPAETPFPGWSAERTRDELQGSWSIADGVTWKIEDTRITITSADGSVEHGRIDVVSPCWLRLLTEEGSTPWAYRHDGGTWRIGGALGYADGETLVACNRVGTYVVTDGRCTLYWPGNHPGDPLSPESVTCPRTGDLLTLPEPTTELVLVGDELTTAADASIQPTRITE